MVAVNEVIEFTLREARQAVQGYFAPLGTLLRKTRQVILLLQDKTGQSEKQRQPTQGVSLGEDQPGVKRYYRSFISEDAIRKSEEAMLKKGLVKKREKRTPKAKPQKRLNKTKTPPSGH